MTARKDTETKILDVLRRSSGIIAAKAKETSTAQANHLGGYNLNFKPVGTSPKYSCFLARTLEKIIISAEAKVICFDEFFVSDITDAMILGTLMSELFERGVVLVATSNIIPDGLYKDGLQRARFLPAIELLKIHTQIVNVDGGVDYRLRALQQAELYHFPLDVNADISLQKSFRSLLNAGAEEQTNEVLTVEGRPIQSRYSAEGVIWFDFEAICDGPRSQNDYIELAREYHSVIISNVPGLGRSNDDQARRFVNLVDEFYDRQVKLVLSAALSLPDLYSDGKLNFEFQRTVSRLLEMQSYEYLAKPHRPE
ncbi:MAG: cell division protein ZapE [Chitinophagaceae bacterium]|nr:MAG: cell division protein ZapE [Chitinophagaceae bacterium]